MEQRNPGIWIGAAVALAVVIVAVSIPRHRDPASVSQPSEVTIRKEQTTPSSAGGTETKSASSSSPTAAADLAAKPSASPHSVNPTAPAPPAVPLQLPPLSTDLTRENVVHAIDNVQFAIRDHRAALGGNPVGTNVEITNALFGDNVKQIRQPMPDGSRINGSGELCDPWGTPYFFHQESAQKMEVRSAGPDLTMWTSDDIQL